LCATLKLGESDKETTPKTLYIQFLCIITLMLLNKLTFKVVTLSFYVCNLDHILCLAGSGITDCGVGMRTYIPIQI
jgi:hypothetical protein